MKLFLRALPNLVAALMGTVALVLLIGGAVLIAHGVNGLLHPVTQTICTGTTAASCPAPARTTTGGNP